MPPTTGHTPDTVNLDRLDVSRRLRPADRGHVTALADVLDACPPITVHRTSMRVVDGHMRVDAARERGVTALPVTWIDGDETQLIELATALNTRHGLPLTHPQRRDAALRLLDLAPDWSNRRIATAAGVSEATVRRLRCPGASATPLDARSGSDGKSYLVDPEPARRHARHILAAEPAISDRAVARRTGLSPTTVGRLRRESQTPSAQCSGTAFATAPETQRGLRVLRRCWRWLRRWLGGRAF